MAQKLKNSQRNPQTKPLASSDHRRRQSPRAKSPVIDGQPRDSLIGSSKSMNDSQIIGANHGDGYNNGTIAPSPPNTIRIMTAGFDNPILVCGIERLKIVSRNNSAVMNRSGNIVANAQS